MKAASCMLLQAVPLGTHNLTHAWPKRDMLPRPVMSILPQTQTIPFLKSGSACFCVRYCSVRMTSRMHAQSMPCCTQFPKIKLSLSKLYFLLTVVISLRSPHSLCAKPTEIQNFWRLRQRFLKAKKTMQESHFPRLLHQMGSVSGLSLSGSPLNFEGASAELLQA